MLSTAVYEFTCPPYDTLFTKNSAKLMVNLGGTHQRDRLERRSPGTVLLQPFDCGLCVLLIIHDEVVDRPAEGSFDGKRQVFVNFDCSANWGEFGGQYASFRRFENRSGTLGEALMGIDGRFDTAASSFKRRLFGYRTPNGLGVGLLFPANFKKLRLKLPNCFGGGTCYGRELVKRFLRFCDPFDQIRESTYDPGELSLCELFALKAVGVLGLGSEELRISATRFVQFFLTLDQISSERLRF
jgi:hypothetical protein